MLVSLHVKNLALIDETEVYFGNGLNILTGETGAGKSIIIGSVNLALGAKADKEMIRTGADYALVELVFQVEKEKQIQQVKSLELPIEEDGTVLIKRRIMPGKSVCKVGDETVSIKQLKALAEILIDIHGQHEHQSLLKPIKQLAILDEYAGKALEDESNRLRECYKRYREIEAKLQENDVDEETRKRECALAEFEWKEIEEAALKLCEDETLEKTYQKLINGQKIKEALDTAHRMSGYENGGAGDAIGRALKEIRLVTSYDETLQEFEKQLLDIEGLLNDYNRAAAEYLSDLEFDEVLFAETEKRLNTVNHLKSKYGKTIEEVLSYQRNLQEKLECYQDYDAYRQKLKESYDASYQELSACCEKVSKIRQKSAGGLAQSMKDALIDLNFMDVAFTIQVEQDKEHISADGYDKVTFMISVNPGEAMRPLSQIASGGELSRVMLALKTVLADKDDTQTLIFDEIDAGIGGRTAWKISEKMGILGKKHQLICITHLPQIAAMADTHFRIYKSVNDNRTATQICELPEEDSVEELARMLGGESITENVRNNAKEMKDLARKSKQN